MKRLVIDTDPGVDDALALILAFGDPDTRVDAITVVAGNVGLERTVPNACTILDVLDVKSAGRPSSADATGLSWGTGSPRPPTAPTGSATVTSRRRARPVEAEHAAVALVRLANESPGELTLVALGPLTNLAAGRSTWTRTCPGSIGA